jgi:hypothetical protein
VRVNNAGEFEQSIRVPILNGSDRRGSVAKFNIHSLHLVSNEFIKFSLVPWIPAAANPTITSYNTSAVKIYNATGRLVRSGAKYFRQLLKTL